MDLPTMIGRDIGPDEARRELYGIMKADLPFEQKAEQALALGKLCSNIQHIRETRCVGGGG